MVSPENSELIASTEGGNTLVYITYMKTDKPRKAVAVEMSNIEFASVLHDVVGFDTSGIPYFGTTVLPTIVLTYATDDIQLFHNDPFLHDHESSIEKVSSLQLSSASLSPITLQYSKGGVPTFQTLPMDHIKCS